MPDFSIAFTNASSTTFKLIRGSTPSDPILDTINQSPSNELAKFGNETFAWSQAASTIASENNGSVYWEDSSSGEWFGVKIHAPLQIFMIGTAPYYQVSFWNPHEDKRDWFTPVDQAGITYDFPGSVRWKIRIRPTAAHTTLSLAVSISDKH